MRGVIAAVLFVGVGVGCTPTSSMTTDAGDPPQGSMLRLGWSANPASVPGSASNDVSLASARFSVHDLRVIGDAGPGDPRTSVKQLELDWHTGETPAVTAFPMAPLGRYSRVAFEVEGDAASVAMTGTVVIDGNSPVPYALTDSGEMVVSVDIDVELVAGADTTIVLSADLAKIATSIDYKSLPSLAGTRTLTSLDPQASKFESEVRAAFSNQSTQ